MFVTFKVVGDDNLAKNSKVTFSKKNILIETPTEQTISVDLGNEIDENES